MIIFEINEAATLPEALARQVGAKLRRKTDIAMWSTRHVLAMLPDTDKKGALATMERLKPVFDGYPIDSTVLSFPQDVDTKEEYLKKIPL